MYGLLCTYIHVKYVMIYICILFADTYLIFVCISILNMLNNTVPNAIFKELRTTFIINVSNLSGEIFTRTF